jgi:hypothetical protein
MAGVNKAACLIVGSMLALIPVSASADTTEGEYNIQGYGNRSCGAYLEARKVRNPDALHYTTWLTGYMTALNQQMSDTYDLSGSTDVAGLMGWLDNWCHQHPTEYFAYASYALVKFLYPKRTRVPK